MFVAVIKRSAAHKRTTTQRHTHTHTYINTLWCANNHTRTLVSIKSKTKQTRAALSIAFTIVVIELKRQKFTDI